MNPSYTDYIASLIKAAIHEDSTQVNGKLNGAGKINYDLDKDGWLASHTKFINISDRNGRLYEITIKDLTKWKAHTTTA